MISTTKKFGHTAYLYPSKALSNGEFKSYPSPKNWIQNYFWFGHKFKFDIARMCLFVFFFFMKLLIYQ